MKWSLIVLFCISLIISGAKCYICSFFISGSSSMDFFGVIFPIGWLILIFLEFFIDFGYQSFVQLYILQVPSSGVHFLHFLTVSIVQQNLKKFCVFTFCVLFI